MNKYESIIFDLDGTLTDPQEGIVKSVLYAFDKLGLPLPSDEEIISSIGEPLESIFSRFVKDIEPHTLTLLVSGYRERYNLKGKFENVPYLHVEEMLQKLTANRNRLFIATTKPQNFAVEILKHFQMDCFFEKIYGSFQDGRMSNKSELLNCIIKTHEVKTPSLMVGDRKYDIIAALENGIDSLGVSYGYGSIKELEDAKANHIVTSVLEIVDYVVK